MRLISCHIENFGKLQNCSMNFEEGINIFCEENGWGKSTFAVFLRAMFYGLEGDRKRKIEENERKRYQPWQGGVFGGRLTFEVGGKKYTISRIFKKRLSDDVFELRDATTNLISEDFSSNIGEELFQMNRESFMRTIFIEQKQCATNTTDDINAKIGNLTENSNDMNSFEKANKRLTNLLNAMSKKRKTGSLAKRKLEIVQLERRVKEREALVEKMRQLETQVQEQLEKNRHLKQRQEQLCIEQLEVAKQKAILVNVEEWQYKKQSLEKKTQIVKEMRKQFPGEMPKMQEIKEQISDDMQMEKIKERLHINQLSKEEEREFSNLEADFSEQKLKKEEIEVSFEAEKLEVSKKIVCWQEGINQKAQISLDEKTLLQKRESQKERGREKKKKQEIAQNSNSGLLIVASILLIVGSILFLAKQSILAILAYILCFGLYSKLIRRQKQEKQRGKVLGFDREDDEEEKQIQYLEARIEENRKLLEELYETLQQYLQQYHKTWNPSRVSADLQEILESLYDRKNRAFRYLELVQKKQAYANAKSEYLSIQRKRMNFLNRYDFPMEEDGLRQLQEMKKVMEEYQYACKEQEIAKVELQDFERKHDKEKMEKLCNREEKSKESLEEINDTLQRVNHCLEEGQESIYQNQNILKNLQQEYQDLEQEETHLEELKQIQAEEEKKYTCLEIVQKKLVESKNALTMKYAGPILDRFHYYYEGIVGKNEDVFHVDADINMTRQEQGQQREIATLSVGYQDLVGICLRIALVDAMYQKEKPMLVFDDPFTNFDDEKAKAGMDFLSSLSKSYQIIYFTCSNSRK